MVSSHLVDLEGLVSRLSAITFGFCKSPKYTKSSIFKEAIGIFQKENSSQFICFWDEFPFL